MKTILMVIICFFSLSAFACKPGGLESCSGGRVSVDQKSFAQLLKKIKKYQAQMDRVVRYPKNGSSCFNNHFANHYGDLFLKELETNKGQSCPKNILIVEKAFTELVSTTSAEFKALPKGGKDFFEEEAEKIQSEINKFFSKLKR